MILSLGEQLSDPQKVGSILISDAASRWVRTLWI